MAAIDSSAPETTSSDNSPTLVRRYMGGKRQGPGSDSGSSGGNSSDSMGSGGDKGAGAAAASAAATVKARDNER